MAVTRAQALLIVIGDPSVLSLDPLWRKFLNFVYNNGGWDGDDPSWDPEAEVDDEGLYDRQVRAAAVADVHDFAGRLEDPMLGDILLEE